ncbi:MAG: DUF2934 domain-containing protein [Rhizobiaceae bacterium]|nr:DUF2934 domain-containing protein [Rhizobiaceae bacterium]
MSGNRDERIRERAHAIWDREGKPEGEAERHWKQAEQEIDQEAKGPPAKKRSPVKKTAAPQVTLKAKKQS